MATGRRGFAFGVKQSAVPLTAMLAGLAVPVFAVTVGWRWAFGAAAALGLFALGGSTWVLVVAGAMTFGLGWAWNGVFIYAVMEVNRGAPAAATGVIMVAEFVGGTAGPLLFGITASRVSYTAWIVAASLLLAAAAHLQLARRSMRAAIRPAAR